MNIYWWILIIDLLSLGLLFYLGYWSKEKKMKDTWKGAKTMEMNKANKLSDEWDKAHPVLSFFQNCYYELRRKDEIPGDTYREIKWFIQRRKRGFSERDVWGFDYYLSDIIINGLKKLKAQIHGYPIDLKNMEEWEQIIEEIIWTFEVTKKIQDSEWLNIPERQREKLENLYKDRIHIMTKAEKRRYSNGWKLFQKYYFSLWD